MPNPEKRAFSGILRPAARLRPRLIRAPGAQGGRRDELPLIVQATVWLAEPPILPADAARQQASPDKRQEKR